MSVPVKRCRVCATAQPETEFFFFNKARNKRVNRCRACFNKWQAQRRKSRKKPVTEKRCERCKQIKPIAAFLQPSMVSKRVKICNDCKETKRRITDRTYRSENAEIYRQATRKYRRANPEKVDKLRRAWDKANPEKRRHINSVAGSVRRARERDAPGGHTFRDIESKLELQGGKCYYCKRELKRMHIEHKIPLARGGTNWPANIAIACPRCNRKKHVKTAQEYKKNLHHAASSAST